MVHVNPVGDTEFKNSYMVLQNQNLGEEIRAGYAGNNAINVYIGVNNSFIRISDVEIELLQTAVPVDNYSWNGYKTTIKVGDKIFVNPVFLPANATDTSVKTWASYNTSIVTVDSYGVITGVAPGTTGIYFHSNSNNKYGSFDVTVEPVAGGSDIVHNFTTSGITSDFFTIVGNTATNKGSVTYDNLTLTTCLKMETATKISFSITENKTLILVLGAVVNGTNEGANKNVKINDTNYKSNADGIITLDLTSGNYEIKKQDVANLFYIKLQ